MAQLSAAFDIQRLRVLVEVADRGGVTRAAEALMLSQPTVSQHLKSLGEMLGVPVVERHGRVTRLTEAGRIVERHARRALAELERAQEAVDRHRGLAAGSLAVGAGTTPGTYLVPRLLGEFHRRWPEVELRLEVDSTAAILDALHAGELHVGLVGEAPARPDVEQRPLTEDRLVCIVPPGHAAAARGEILRAELRAGTLLVRRAGSSSQAVTDRHLARHGIEVAERWEIESPEAVKQAVRAGLGVAFVSELTIADEVADGRLAVVAVEGVPPLVRTIDVARSAVHALTPAERAFLGLLEEAALSAGRPLLDIPPAPGTVR